MKEKIPGLLVASMIGIVAFLVAKFNLLGFKISSVLIGLVVGVVIANVVKLPTTLKPGIKFSGKTILNWAIIFLGFGISFQDISLLGLQSVALLAILIVVVLLLTIFIGNRFGGKKTTNILVGFGTAICGSSAIAAVSSSVTEDQKDVGIAVAVVNFLGLLGMLAFPIALAFIPMDQVHAGTLIGGSLQAVGNVAGAGFALGDGIGNLAVTVKLGRVALLAPALIFFNIVYHKESSILQHLKLPYYIWGFIIASTIVSLFALPVALLNIIQNLGKVLLTIAMVGIGLNISIRELWQNGKKALGFGIVMFAIQISVTIGLILILL